MSMDFPYKDKKRAKRRADKERRRRQELRKIDHQYSSPATWFNNFEQWREDYARRHADNPKSCSCWMCCNPRKYGQLTLQEKRVSQRERFCE